MTASRVVPWVGGVLASVVAVAAVAQNDEPEPGAPVLHEDVRSPLLDQGSERPRATSADSVIGAEPAAGKNPTAIGTGEKILPEPKDDTEARGSEPILGQSGFAADRRTEHKADTQTGADGTLRYVEVFNPSILPFKRMSAYDAVRDNYTLYIGDQTLTDLSVGGAPTEGYDRFWGSVLIDLQPGVDVPLPSVSPSMRILSYEAEPHIQLTFSKDGADNYYVRSDESGVEGVRRLIFLVEADPVYFAPRMPERVRVRDIPADRIRPMPESVRAMANHALETLRIHRNMPLHIAVDRLVEYHRAFQPKPIAHPDRDVFWELFSNQAGVCRHRSFSFVIAANALGIPARFVGNEAHAFVEIWVPQSGWLRVDLGGAALELQVENAEGKTMYQPRGEDPFPKPPEYTENYTQLTGDVSGLTQSQRDEARQTRSESGDGGGTGSGDGTGAGDTGLPAAGPGQDLPAMPDSVMAGKTGTTIVVTSASTEGFRGEMVDIEGRVTGHDGARLGGVRVDVYLAPAGSGGEDAVMIGRTVTAADGSFLAHAPLPYDLDLAEHEVFAATSGNQDYQPAVSR